MSEAIGYILMACTGFVTIGCVWALICNHRTYRQRMKLIDWVYDHGLEVQSIRHKKFSAVSYDDHFWALFFFRDPKALYKFEQDAA